jgi:beta-phosphoglucomutase-like phosphatase (HAD superfamily)
MRKILIVDLDGTLYDNRHRNTPELLPNFDAIKAEGRSVTTEDWLPWNRRHEGDKVVEHVRALVRAFRAQGFIIAVLSSRDDRCRDTTRHQLDRDLDRDVVVADFIWLRPADCQESAAEYKRQKVKDLKSIFGGSYPPPLIVAIDDDPAVIKMFAAEGIHTLQVRRPGE